MKEEERIELFLARLAQVLHKLLCPAEETDSSSSENDQENIDAKKAQSNTKARKT